MKIHLALPFPPPNYGPSIYSKNLLESLKFLGYDVVVTNTEINKATSDIGTLSPMKYFKVLMIAIKIFIKSSNAHTFMNINLSTQGIIRSYIFFFPALLSSSKINVIFHEGSIEKFYENYRPIVKKLFKKIINNAEKIILLDCQQKISLEKFIKPTKLFVLGAYRNDTFNSKIIKENKIVFYSNLIEDKGARDAIDAYLRLNKEDKQKWKLVIAGNIKDPAFYEDIFKSYNTEVTFFTNKTYSEYISLLNSSKIFIYPTKYKYEQQPAVLIEALMNKLVVVSYDWAGTKSMLPEKYAYLCKNSVEDLYTSLKKLINENNINLYMNESREHYLNNYDKDIFNMKLKKLF